MEFKENQSFCNEWFGVQNYDWNDWIFETKHLEAGQQSAAAFIFRNDDCRGSSKRNRLSHQMCLVGWNLFLPLPRILTWHMKLGMTLWKEEPLNPKPFSPVQRARKFSEVFGTTSARSWTEIEESFLIVHQQWRDIAYTWNGYYLALFKLPQLLFENCNFHWIHASQY